MKRILVRKASLSDIACICEIYNEAIVNTVATFDTVPKTLSEQRDWYMSRGDRYPVFVAEDETKVIGWASINAYSDRLAYSQTAEISIYVSFKSQGKGAGKALMGTLIEAAKQSEFHVLLARITSGNQVSVQLHRAFGFQLVGVMKEVGKKFNQLLDVHLYQWINNE